MSRRLFTLSPQKQATMSIQNSSGTGKPNYQPKSKAELSLARNLGEVCEENNLEYRKQFSRSPQRLLATFRCTYFSSVKKKIANQLIWPKKK